MANSSSPVSTGDKITALGYNNLRTDAIGPYGNERVWPDNIAAKFGTGENVSITFNGTNLQAALSAPASLLWGDTSNANMTQGITINQGAADDEILAGKSSDVAHGLTGLAETDTFFSFRKHNATGGGLQIRVLHEDDASDSVFNLQVYGGTAAITKTTAGRALAEIVITENDGAGGQADITADGNVFSVRARVGGSVVTRMLVDEDGDLYSVTAAQTFDDYDDLALIDSYDRIRSGYMDWAKEHEQQLIDLKVLGGPVSEGGMTNLSQLSRLLTGAVRQIGARLDTMESRLALTEGK